MAFSLYTAEDNKNFIIFTSNSVKILPPYYPTKKL
jgi:hypothetical protein